MNKPLEGPKHGKAFWGKSWQLLTLFLALTFASHAQDSAKYSRIQGFGFGYKRFDVDSLFFVPLFSSPHVPYRQGALKYNPADSSLYLWTGFQWRRSTSSSSSIDSTTAGSGMFLSGHALGWSGRLSQNATISAANIRSITFDSTTTFIIQNAGGNTSFLFDWSNPLIQMTSGSVFWRLRSDGVLVSTSTSSSFVGQDSTSFSQGKMMAFNIGDSLMVRNLPASTDTTKYKPIGVASNGRVAKMGSWPGGGGSGGNLDSARSAFADTVKSPGFTPSIIKLVDKGSNKAGLISPLTQAQHDSMYNGQIYDSIYLKKYGDSVFQFVKHIPAGNTDSLFQFIDSVGSGSGGTPGVGINISGGVVSNQVGKFAWNNLAPKLRLQDTTRYDMNSPEEAAIGASSLLLADTAGALSNPVFIAMQKGTLGNGLVGGGSIAYKQKVRFGTLGFSGLGNEGNISIGMNYVGGVHQSDDSTKDCLWYYLSQLGMGVQAAAAGHYNNASDIWTQTKQQVPIQMVIDKDGSGNYITGWTNMYAHRYTLRDLSDTTQADMSLTYSSTQLHVNTAQEFGSPKLRVATGGSAQEADANKAITVKTAGGFTYAALYNDESNSNGTWFYSEKRRGNSHSLTTGDNMGGFSAAGVGLIEFKASADAPGAFSSPDMDIKLQDAGGTMRDYFHLLHTGFLGLGVTSPTAIIDLKAATSSNASFHMATGTPLTSPVNGTLEYVDPYWMITANSATRDTIATRAFARSLGGGGGGSTPNWESVLNQGGSLSADNSYRVAGHKITIIGTNGLAWEVKGATPTITVNDTVNTITGSIKMTGGEFNISTSSNIIRTNNSIFTQNASNTSTNYDFNIGGGFRSIIESNPHSLTEPNLFWNKVATGTPDQMTVYRQDGNYAMAILNAGTIVIGSSKTNNSTGQLQIGSTSAQLALHYDNTHYSTFTTSSSGNLTITPSSTDITLAATNIKLTHIIGQGSAPTTSVLGTNVTSATITGTDNDFQMVVVTSGNVNGTICTINWATAWASAPLPVFSPKDAATGIAASQMWCAGLGTTTGSFGGTLTGAGTYTFNFHVAN